MSITIKGGSTAVTDTKGKQTNTIVTAAEKVATIVTYGFITKPDTHGTVLIELLNAASAVVDSKVVVSANVAGSFNSNNESIELKIGPVTQQLEKMTWDIAQGDVNYQDGKLRVTFFGTGGDTQQSIIADSQGSFPASRVDIADGGRTTFEVPFSV